MKKYLLFFALLIILSTNIYAGFVIKEGISNFGLFNEIKYDPFNDAENYKTNKFSYLPFQSIEYSFLQEFEPKETLHVTAGLSLGMAVDNFILLSLNTGTAFKINKNLDLNFSFCPGTAIFFAFEGSTPYYYLKNSLELEIMPFGRRYVFFCTGISNQLGFACKKYEDFGIYWQSEDRLFLSLQVGYRF